MFPITPALPDDAAVIHAIQMRAFAEEARLSRTDAIPPLQETIADIADLIRTQTVLVAKDDARIVGSARGLVTGPVCTIRGVSVEPSYQGRGIGASLVRAVEQQHPHVARFELTTNTLVPGNVAFYERRGYRIDRLREFSKVVLLAEMSKPGGGA